MQDVLTTFPKRSSFVGDSAWPMVCRQCCLRFGMARWNFTCTLPNLSVDLLPRRRTTFNVGLANRYYMSFQGAIVLAKHKLKEACTFHSNNSSRPPRQLGKASNFPRRFQACGPPQRGCRHLGTLLAPISTCHLHNAPGSRMVPCRRMQAAWTGRVGIMMMSDRFRPSQS